eukprot:CAMPEP_0172460130 /NCGR_PEP_ID=MMETSP1065-20121228/35650_1 /TAXON_ID=265537 /ORGANISM="Amphiprora paludosa, Strain CCMP125" /LENGTH=54 /DNA_ID=CAMNT_0013215067 /DNA_START=9 /DNA_END=170 /DNA_ORIENTATION=+
MDDWWIRKYQSYGFVYDEGLSQEVKMWAQQERSDKTAVAPNGEHYNPQHVAISM